MERTNEQYENWPQMMRTLDAVQDALQGIECPEKLVVLALASGIMLHHLTYHHELEDASGPAEQMRLILQAFMADMQQATLNAGLAQQQWEKQEAEEPATEDWSNNPFAKLPIKGVH